MIGITSLSHPKSCYYLGREQALRTTIVNNIIFTIPNTKKQSIMEKLQHFIARLFAKNQVCKQTYFSTVCFFIVVARTFAAVHKMKLLAVAEVANTVVVVDTFAVAQQRMNAQQMLAAAVANTVVVEWNFP